MVSNLPNTVFEYLKDNVGQSYTAREIAEWIWENKKEYCKNKINTSTTLKNKNDLLKQLVAEISRDVETWSKKNILITSDMPRKYYYDNSSSGNFKSYDNLKLKSLNIKYFRHMNDVSIEIGDALTIVSGLNGTGKSSILGLIGHLFSFRYNLSGTSKKFPYVTITDEPFETEYSEIFKFCPEHDIGNNYSYSVLLNDDKGSEIRKYGGSRWVDAEKRFRMDVGDKEGHHGSKLTHPVVYLGLKRLYPMSQEDEKRVKVSNSRLEKQEKDFFNLEAKNILTSLDKTVGSDFVSTSHKYYEAIKTANYSSKGLSAGQDNISQILTSILSFGRLKTSHKGGILLIDELDSTLFPAAQISLLEKLYSYAKKYNLQIIFTTHSLEIIDALQKRKWPSNEWKINFLELRDCRVLNTVNPSNEYIHNRILLQTKQKPKIKKTHLLCEDKVASLWAKALLNGNSILKEKCEVHASNLGEGALKNLAKEKLSCFDDFIFVLDADMKSKFIGKKNIGNLLFLPGGKAPETEMYNYLNNLSDSDEFWGKEDFFKDTCFYGAIGARDENTHKNWLSEIEANLGRGYARFFRRWKVDNKEAIEEFQNAVLKHINQ